MINKVFDGFVLVEDFFESPPDLLLSRSA